MYIPLNPILHALKNRHGTPNFWHRASFTHVETTSCGSPKNFEHWCHITFGTDTFTHRKLGVPCLKIVSTVPKIWRAVPTFLARVNGVLVIIPGETSCIARSRDEIISLWMVYFLFNNRGSEVSECVLQTKRSLSPKEFRGRSSVWNTTSYSPVKAVYIFVMYSRITIWFSANF